MRLKISRSKNSASLYIIKSTWINGVHSTKIVERLGTETELREKLKGQDPYEWAKKYIEELNQKEKEETRKILVPFEQSMTIVKDEQHSFKAVWHFKGA